MRLPASAFQLDTQSELFQYYNIGRRCFCLRHSASRSRSRLTAFCRIVGIAAGIPRVGRDLHGWEICDAPSSPEHLHTVASFEKWRENKRSWCTCLFVGLLALRPLHIHRGLARDPQHSPGDTCAGIMVDINGLRLEPQAVNVANLV
jgi:hypothetical protein